MKKGFRITGIVIAVFVVFVLVTNLIPPLFHQEVSEWYQDRVQAAEYESDTPGTERILCIDDNEEALLWRLRMIADARESIVLSTFDLRADHSGTDIISALYQAAERGVQVCLLLDGIYKIPYLDSSDTFHALCAHENVEVRFYNPVSLRNICRVNYRMHDKYLLVDDRMFLLGGRNTNDIFLGNYQKGINIDRDILVYETQERAGESLVALQRYFEEIWEEPCVRTEEVKMSQEQKEAVYVQLQENYGNLEEKYGELAGYDGWFTDTYEVDKITLVTNGVRNENKVPQILYEMEKLCEKGKDILVQTPYVICNRSMYEVLSRISENANMSLIINAVERGSNPWGCSDYLNNKEKILDTGTTVYELMNEHAVHTKTVLVDDNISIIGSYNLDMRSTYLDTEMMLVIDSKELNAHIRDMTEEYMKKSKEVLPDGTEQMGALYKEKELPLKKKMFYTFLKIIIRPFRYLL